MPTDTTSSTRPLTTKVIFHLDLSDTRRGEDHWMVANGRRYPLVPHTADSREAACAIDPKLAAATHYHENAVELPAGTVMRVHNKSTLRGVPGAQGEGVGKVAIYIAHPPEVEQRMAEEGTVRHELVDWNTTAQALIFHHLDLVAKKPAIAARVYEHMGQNEAIKRDLNNLAMLMRSMGEASTEPGKGWAQLDKVARTENSSLSPDVDHYACNPRAEVLEHARPVMLKMMVVTKNDAELKDKKWTQKTGQSVRVEDGPTQLRRAAALATAAAGDAWTAKLANEGETSGLTVKLEVVDAGKQQVKLTFSNTYIRYLGAYIRFRDKNDDPIAVPAWTPDTGGGVVNMIAADLKLQDEHLRFLGYMNPVTNVFAVPVMSDPGKLEVTVTFPAKAVAADIYGSGLGTGENPWPMTPLIGGFLTGFLNLGVPAFMLGFAVAAQSYQGLYDAVDKLIKDEKFLAALGLAAAAFFSYKTHEASVDKDIDWQLFANVVTLIFDKSATTLLAWVFADLTAEAVVEEIPFAGWFMIAVNIATGIAQITETIVEVARSPWNIENRISLAINSSVNLLPDPRHNVFPSGGKASYTVRMIYDSHARTTVAQDHEVPDVVPATLSACFIDNPLGGQVKFEADYYVDGWLAGRATSGWMDNDACATDVKLTLVENPIPLTKDSKYAHEQLLTFNGDDYAWIATPRAPTATVTSADASGTGNAISRFTGLTLSERHGVLGMCYMAAGTGLSSDANDQKGQLNVMQTVGIPGAAAKPTGFPPFGFDGQALLVFDPYPPRYTFDDGKPKVDPTDHSLGDYWVDPRKALQDGGGYYLRQIDLAAAGNPLDEMPGEVSFGRFSQQPELAILHPSGYVVAINVEYKQIMITPLAAKATPDKEIPRARVFAGEAVDPDRPGLIFHPVAVACSFDGTILVLEDTKAAGTPDALVLARIQAFDLQGRPVDHFLDAKGQPTPFLPLDAKGDYTYRDMVAVGDQKLTYIFVGYYDGDGSSPTQYHVSVYQCGTGAPRTNPLVTTDALVAARIAVDMWHTLYTLNFDMVTDGHGNHAGPKTGDTGPAGRTVPSISAWRPPRPARSS